jgi:hypothetical protein
MSNQYLSSENSETPNGQSSGGKLMLVFWSMVGICVVVGIIIAATVALSSIPSNLRQQTEDKVFRVMMNQTDDNLRIMATALASYNIDYNAYGCISNI